jgi:hypothetical protein
MDLRDYENKTRESVMAFWGNRNEAIQKQEYLGVRDQGERAAVTRGKNMDGFVAMALDLARANSHPRFQFRYKQATLTLPGYFRPTKRWDLLVLDGKRLVAAMEFKSLVGPSFGKNFNNRAEEAIGTALDFRTAYREGAFGSHPPPFLGWLILVEDAPKSQRPVNDRSPYFDMFPEFRGASYIHRFDVMCQKLVKEQLYSAACVITSPRTAIADGTFEQLSDLSGLRTFVTRLAGHLMTETVRVS